MLPASIKLSINKDSSVPVRDQLIEQLGLQIASGTIRSRDKLPSIRQLAERLGIHHSTVTSAYTHLAEVGLLDIRQGSGVRVAARPATRESEAEKLPMAVLLRDFLGHVAEHGYSAKDVETCLESVLKRKQIKRILVVDRNVDFHKLLLAELQPHFKLPVQPISYDDIKDVGKLLDDSLVVTSLYHLFPLQNLNLDPTRFVVCNIEPGRAELDVIRTVPAGSIVLIVSVSPTLLRMATNVAAAVRGEEVAIRTVLTDDTKELKYMMKYAAAVICDSPSQDSVKALSGKLPVSVFNLYAPSTIQLIQDRLQKWG